MTHIPGHAATNTFYDFNPGWWKGVLEEYEPGQYYSSPTGIGFGKRSPRRQRYFQNSYQDILQNYYGKAGTAMREGKAPISFMDYLETNPWTARYSSLPQASRGVTGMAANPRTRFLFNY
jgi:hypothetical protein